jgi:hypothetical protein
MILIKKVEAEPMTLSRFLAEYKNEHYIGEDKYGYLTTDKEGVEVWVNAEHVGPGKLYEMW